MRITTFGIWLICIFFSTSTLFAQDDAPKKLSKGDALAKIDAIFTLINYAYVDDVDNNKMSEDAIVALLEELDPHSVYIPEKEKRMMNEPLEGNFEGIGIQFNILKDTLTVISPISGGPSEKLGIQAGDKIIFIEGINVAGTGLTNSDVQKKLRGKKGSVVNIEIKRNGEKNLISYDIVRDKIPIYSIDASYMATPDVAYIKINRFAKNTMDEFKLALDSLKESGATGLILDLRGNGGGYLQTAFHLADEFLSKDKMIVYTEGKKQSKQEFRATTVGDFEKGKLIVLVDEGSASASEIVSGAVQDWDRGIVIGRRTFGKGLVQKPFPLPDGSEVRLTTARYYTPTGRSIQRPYEDGKEEYYKEFQRRYEHGEFMVADSINFPDSLKFFTPNKRIVYGGGGIMPDIFVPVDTSMNSELNRNLIRRGVYNDFVLAQLDKNRKKLLKEFPNIAVFKEGFKVDQELLDKFFEFAEKKKVERNDEQYLKSKVLIDTQLVALYARNLYSISAYFEIINNLNESYLKALSILEGSDFEKAFLQEN